MEVGDFIQPAKQASKRNLIWRFQPERPGKESSAIPKEILSYTSGELNELFSASKFPGFHDGKQANDCMEKASGAVIHALQSPNKKVGIIGDYDADGINAAVLLSRALNAIAADFKEKDSSVDQAALNLRTESLSLSKNLRQQINMAQTTVINEYEAQVEPRVISYIPTRSDGHGVNNKALELMKKKGVSVVIIVDSGVNARQAIEYARSIGLKTVVLDHHIPDYAGEISQPNFLIDPHSVKGSSDEQKKLTGAGLSWVFAKQLFLSYKKTKGNLDSEKYDPNLSKKIEELEKELSIYAAFGTVGDVADLTSKLNYLIVDTALKYIASIANPEDLSRRNPGVAGILEALELDPKKLDAKDIGRYICPLINACNRVGGGYLNSILGEEIGNNIPFIGAFNPAFYALTSGIQINASFMLEIMDLLNQQRRVFQDEVNICKTVLDYSSPLLVATVPMEIELDRVMSGTPGMIGPVANQLVEAFYRPAVVCSVSWLKASRRNTDDCVGLADKYCITEEKSEPRKFYAVASCRAPWFFDVSKLIKNGKAEGIISSGGGHNGAGGFRIDGQTPTEVMEKIYKIQELGRKMMPRRFSERDGMPSLAFSQVTKGSDLAEIPNKTQLEKRIKNLDSERDPDRVIRRYPRLYAVTDLYIKPFKHDSREHGDGFKYQVMVMNKETGVLMELPSTLLEISPAYGLDLEDFIKEVKDTSGNQDTIGPISVIARVGVSDLKINNEGDNKSIRPLVIRPVDIYNGDNYHQLVASKSQGQQSRGI